SDTGRNFVADYTGVDNKRKNALEGNWKGCISDGAFGNIFFCDFQGVSFCHASLYRSGESRFVCCHCGMDIPSAEKTEYLTEGRTRFDNRNLPGIYTDYRVLVGKAN